MHRLEAAFDRFALRPNTPAAYAAAVGLVAAGLGVRWLIAPPEAGFPFVTLFPAVLLTCFVGGLGPSLLAALLAVLGALYFFVPPIGSLAPRAADVWGVATFVVSVLLGVVPIALLRHAVRVVMQERARVSGLLGEKEELLRQKDLLLREIHHRVRNSLQTVASLLNLQSTALRDEAVRRPFDEARGRVQAIAAVHQALYQRDDLARVRFADFVHLLCDNLDAVHRGPGSGSRCHVEASDVEIAADQIVPLALLVNELVTNAFKHAYPPGQAGPVDVAFTAAPNGDLRLEVGDSGRGLPAGFDPQARGGLGMTLINALARQLGGTVMVERPPQGSRFVVTIPAAARG